MKKILAWLKSHRLSTLILVILLILILILSFTPSPIDKTDPKATSQPQPPIDQFKKLLPDSIDSPTPVTSKLSLISITPTPPEFESIWSTEKISLTFDQIINPDTISYQVSPSTRTKTIFDDSQPQTFSIVPLTGWQENQTYAITISQNLSTPNQYQLDSPLTFTITRRLPDLDDLPNQSY